MGRTPNEDSEEFITEVCWHYYIAGKTQAKIAKIMNATRLRINQAIQKAKAQGIVNIRINSPFISRFELQQRLEDQFDIKKALVVPVDKEPHDYHGPVGAALAHYLEEQLPNAGWKKIGVSWGVTLQSAIEKLDNFSIPDLEILALMGGSTAGASFNAFSIVSGFADKFGANYSHFAAPTYLPENTDRNTFLAQDIYATHIKKCLSADAVLLVAGDVSDMSYMVKFSLPSNISAQNLRDKGAVGDILGIFLDSEGREIDHPINTRVAGIDHASIAKIPNKILTAGGRHKVAIIKAAIKRGLVDTLVTDDLTAELLLES